MDTIHSDGELVQASLKGQLSAFEYLVRRYQDVLFRNALCYVHRPEDAQDMVQDAFLKAFEELSTLDNPEKFGGWMRTMVRNSCLNALRSHRREITSREEMGRELAEQNRGLILNFQFQTLLSLLLGIEANS